MPVTINGSGTIGGLSSTQQGAGLTLVASQSFTAASTVTFNNVFSSLHRNYAILFNFTGAGAADVVFRLRSAGVDNTASVYTWSYLDTDPANTYAGRVSAQAGWRLARIEDASSYPFGEATVIAPFATEYTGFVSKSISRGQGNQMLSNGVHASASSFDGLSLSFAAAASGNVGIYGYVN